MLLGQGERGLDMGRGPGRGKAWGGISMCTHVHRCIHTRVQFIVRLRCSKCAELTRAFQQVSTPTHTPPWTRQNPFSSTFQLPSSAVRFLTPRQPLLFPGLVHTTHVSSLSLSPAHRDPSEPALTHPRRQPLRRRGRVLLSHHLPMGTWGGFPFLVVIDEAARDVPEQVFLGTALSFFLGKRRGVGWWGHWAGER